MHCTTWDSIHKREELKKKKNNVDAVVGAREVNEAVDKVQRKGKKVYKKKQSKPRNSNNI